MRRIVFVCLLLLVAAMGRPAAAEGGEIALDAPRRAALLDLPPLVRR